MFYWFQCHISYAHGSDSCVGVADVGVLTFGVVLSVLNAVSCEGKMVSKGAKYPFLRQQPEAIPRVISAFCTFSLNLLNPQFNLD